MGTVVVTGVDSVRQGLGIARKRPGRVALCFLHPVPLDLMFTEKRHEIPASLPTEPSGRSLSPLPHLFMNSFNISGRPLCAQHWVLRTQQ